MATFKEDMVENKKDIMGKNGLFPFLCAFFAVASILSLIPCAFNYFYANTIKFPIATLALCAVWLVLGRIVTFQKKNKDLPRTLITTETKPEMEVV